MDPKTVHQEDQATAACRHLGQRVAALATATFHGCRRDGLNVMVAAAIASQVSVEYTRVMIQSSIDQGRQA